MASVNLLSSIAILFGLMIPPAVAEPVGKSIRSVDVQTYRANSSTDWKANELLARYDREEQYSVIDVNDQFLVKSLAEDGFTTVRLGVLDGTREKYGSCVTGPSRENGDSSTTWLQVSYTKPDSGGYRDVTLSRTLDFFGWERIYRFKMGRSPKTLRLDPGIFVAIGADLLTYTQTSGPIGTSGDTKALRVKYRLSDDYRDIRLSTEMDTKMWRIETSQNAGGDTLAYHVNDIMIDPYQSDSSSIDTSPSIIADPERGPGVPAGIDNLVSKVADRLPNEGRDSDVQSEDQINAAFCNQGLVCYTSVQCFTGWGSWCQCTRIRGMYPAICLL